MNRGAYAYKKAKAQWLKSKELHGGWYQCETCPKQTQEPELDHLARTGMGGSPNRLMDTANWSLKCRECHNAKDSGMIVRT